MKSTALRTSLSFLGTVAAAASTAKPASTAPKQAKPNIIVILCDDLGYSDLGCYGSEINTPNLDRLAANGLRFSAFYNTSRSCPTRASLLTGLYQHQAGIGRMTFDDGLPGYRGTLSHNAVTIAEVLREAGYATGMVGKWHVAETPLRHDQREWLAHHLYYPQFADKANYPTHRGFDDFYGTIYGVVDYFDPFSLVEGEEPVREVPANYYITNALSDKATDYVDRYAQGNRPFFLYLAYTAPHWPLHALPEDIAQYENTYKNGWEPIREARYKRMKHSGIFPEADNYLSHRLFADRWQDNPDSVWDARAMSVHAAMVECMDRGIGRLTEALRRNGQLDNTLILFLSDNGCSNEECQNFTPGENDRPDMTRDGQAIVYPRNKEALPGPETTYSGLGPRWANVANTPFRFWKAKAYEGGICTPMIAHCPKGMWRKLKGGVTSERGHVMDIMASCIELAGTSYPVEYNGNSIIPMEGRSLVPIFKKGRREGHKWLGFEHFEQSAMISSDGWKIVRPGDKARWELYDLNVDRTELRDLADSEPAKLAAMIEAYNQWAARAMVVPAPVRK
ncbi:MAG: arylsulfatase [Rikenellaceae bacterium]|jgi:arylsulfatase|nr:arylsulfatase [Rikenellaceae bacterium]